MFVTFIKFFFFSSRYSNLTTIEICTCAFILDPCIQGIFSINLHFIFNLPNFSTCISYSPTFNLVWTLMPPSYCTLHGTQKIFFPNIQHAMKLSFGAKMHHKSPITIFSFSLLPSFKVDGKGEVVTRELLRQTSTHHAKGVN